MDDAIEEMKKLAESRGLRVEEGGSLNECEFYKGEECLGSAWFLEEFTAWTTTEPGSESVADVLEYLNPKPPKQTKQKDLSYYVKYTFGRKSTQMWTLKLPLTLCLTRSRNSRRKLLRVRQMSR